ncbi:MAG: class I SAM-dependent methyltransferase [Dehalococcoidia bacterium]|nr:class I SAM-dependent methyltransferase [Dehalococcoidia bacterium]
MPLNGVSYITRDSCELRTADCGPCNQHWKKIIHIPDRITKIGEFDIYICSKSKLGFTNPYPSEDTAYLLYETKDTTDFDVIRGNIFDKIQDFLAARLIRKIVASRRLNMNAVLDYSTGNGRYAATASRMFPSARVDAVDFQPEAPPLIKCGRQAINYYHADSFSRNTQKYDLIILRHVLEHAHYPVRLLHDLGQHLTSAGILYLEVPNLESGCAAVFKKYWTPYYVPRHIFHFTRESLARAVELAGLEGELHKKEGGSMGMVMSTFTNREPSHVVNKFFAVVLYPLQISIESAHNSSSCFSACLHRK